jgi:hypothetical protein
MRRTLATYFATRRPSKEAIDKAYRKLNEKARAVSKPFQLDIIGDTSKGVFEHVPEESEYKEYAWQKHIELDKEIRKGFEYFQTKTKKNLQGELSTRRIGISGGVETSRALGSTDKTSELQDPML